MKNSVCVLICSVLTLSVYQCYAVDFKERLAKLEKQLTVAQALANKVGHRLESNDEDMVNMLKELKIDLEQTHQDIHRQFTIMKNDIDILYDIVKKLKQSQQKL